MFSARRDIDCEDYNTEKQHETPILLIAWLEVWIMTFPDSTGADENSTTTRQKNFVETFQWFFPISMEQLIGSLYEYVEEWKPEYLVLLLDSFNRIEENNDKSKLIERLFWK